MKKVEEEQGSGKERLRRRTPGSEGWGTGPEASRGSRRSRGPGVLSSGELGGQAAARASASSLPGGRVGFAVPRNFGSRGLTRSDLRPLEKDGKPNKTHGRPALEAEWLEGGKGHGYERHVRDRVCRF